MNGETLQQPTENPKLESLQALVGTWTTEATHPAYPSIVVRGRTAFEWLKGERFLIQRSQADHRDFPDTIAVIGAATEQLSMHYFDSRGLHSVYSVSLSEGTWRMWRDTPRFSQRFTGTFGDDGDTIAGRWRVSRDGWDWDDDLAIAYRRVG